MGAGPEGMTRSAPSRTPPWFLPWLAWLDVALHREILHLRTRYELSLDEMRGLYISDEQVDQLLARRLPDPADREQLAALESHGRSLLSGLREPPSALGTVAREFDLDDAQTLALAVALAPEVDLVYQTVFAYLNDDVARRLPTVDLCQRLVGADGSGSSLLNPEAAVFRCRLLDVVRAANAPLWRSAGLVLSDPVRSYLLGLDGVAGARPADNADPDVEQVAAGIRSGRLRVIVVEGSIDADVERAVRLVAAATGRPLVAVAAGPDDPADRLEAAIVRARLLRGCLYVPESDLEVDAETSSSAAALGRRTLRSLLAAPVVLLLGANRGTPLRRALEGVDHEVLTIRKPAPERRLQLWRSSLAARAVTAQPSDVQAVADLFALSPAQIDAAAAGVGRSSDVATIEVLAREAAGQCATGLQTLARPVELVYTWDDLVLPPPSMLRLRELAAAILHRHEVFDRWSFRRLSGGFSSVRVLFSGASGTGKTMSAGVIARELGLQLCRIDLSTVVSKYIGETEKNLERVFSAAEDANAILMFDEADALFGKRSEVSDAHDRYANIEVSYLLQRMESYDGVLVLATNMPANMDEAFSRRIHLEIEFPLPDESARERLWRGAIPADAPVAEDIDFGFLSRMFPLSGGEIRNVSLSAAFLAAYEQRPIGMDQLVRSVARQRRRQGKLPTAAEFRDYLRLVRAEGG